MLQISIRPALNVFFPEPTSRVVLSTKKGQTMMSKIKHHVTTILSQSTPYGPEMKVGPA